MHLRVANVWKSNYCKWMLVEQIDHKILPSKLCSAKSSANFCPSSVLSYYLFVLFSGPSRSQVVSGFCWLRRDPLGCVAWNVALELMTAPHVNRSLAPGNHEAGQTASIVLSSHWRDTTENRTQRSSWRGACFNFKTHCASGYIIVFKVFPSTVASIFLSFILSIA